MDYLRLRESAIKLADLIKIAPKEDKPLFNTILSEYNNRISKFKNFNPKNNSFTPKELYSIRNMLNTFERSITIGLETKTDKIFEDFCEEVGYFDKQEEMCKIRNRIENIFNKRYNESQFTWGLNYDKNLKLFLDKSKVYAKAIKLHDKLHNIAVDKIDSDERYKKLNSELENIKANIKTFEMSSELKNYVVFRRGHSSQTQLYNASRDTILNELTLEFNNHLNNKK